MISVEAHQASIGSFYNRLKPFSNAMKKALLSDIIVLIVLIDSSILIVHTIFFC